MTALEHARMRPGEVAAALPARTQVVNPGTLDRIAPTCMGPEWCGDKPSATGPTAHARIAPLDPVGALQRQLVENRGVKMSNVHTTTLDLPECLGQPWHPA
ncbi:hypothetical protein ACFSKW_25675 [Nonomuraea mangrovi]|uniref:Uncharacterized protein n=1 Tax=Nonomuraea mangrovi TaxID=2316207 RepID=A0ABW4T111_9ACTN